MTREFFALLVACVAPLPAAAQVQPGSTTTPLGRAAMLERNGSYGEAVTQYQAILVTNPASLGALVGLEHVLPKLDRRHDLIAPARAALLADSTSTGILGVLVRAYAGIGETDSARRYADRWSARIPGDEEPYRDWSEAALDVRDMAQARAAIDAGRARLGQHALSLELAELLQRAGDARGAAVAWLVVVQETPNFRDGAVGVLAQVSPAQRALVRDVLQGDGSTVARQMLGLLLAQWGDPAAGIALIQQVIPADSAGALILLRRFYDAVHLRTDRPSRAALAVALELTAARESASSAARDRLEAAHSYADAGDDRNARRLLGALEATTGAAPGSSSVAATTLLGVLISEGKSAEAERSLSDLGQKIDADTRDLYRRRIAMSWARSGNFGRADSIVASDSSTAGFDLRGRLRLFRGDLAGANDLLKAAGPYDDDRELSLQRVTLLALVQAVGKDSLAELGSALLALERGDSAHAIVSLNRIADSLKGAGAAETRLLTARLSLAGRDTVAAVKLLKQADIADAPGTAAVARLELARISVARGHVDEARATLEALLVDFPDSAVVPEARRLRDSLASPAPVRGS